METTTTNASQPIPACFICGAPLRVTLTHSTKGKVAVGLHCPTDGRHLRAFCNHRPFVEEVVAKVEAQAATAANPTKEPLQNSDPTPAATKGQTGRRGA